LGLADVWTRPNVIHAEGPRRVASILVGPHEILGETVEKIRSLREGGDLSRRESPRSIASAKQKCYRGRDQGRSRRARSAPLRVLGQEVDYSVGRVRGEPAAGPAHACRLKQPPPRQLLVTLPVAMPASPGRPTGGTAAWACDRGCADTRRGFSRRPEGKCSRVLPA